MIRSLVAAFVVAVGLVAAVPSFATQTAPSAKAPVVLFMCPHGAAKSVMASAYFQKLAKERGLNVRVDAVGTDPEPALSKGVVAKLQKDNVPILIDKPRAATAADMKNADVVISMGCDLSKLPAPQGQLKNWNVPDFSANFDAAEQAIRDQVIKLVDEMVAQQKTRK